MRTFVVAVLLCLLSLIAGLVAILLAEFGGPEWVFVLLFGWLLTLGLPSLGAILVSVYLWEGLGLRGFLVSAALLALVFQYSAVSLVRWGIRCLSREKQHETQPT